MIYFILAIVAYFILARFIVLNFDGWKETDLHDGVPPLGFCLFFAIIGALAWPLSLAIVIPMSIYNKRKGK